MGTQSRRHKVQTSKKPKPSGIGKRVPFVNTYAGRDETLKSLGYAGYADYLASDLWKYIREKVLRKAKYTCEGCRAPASEVHHFVYARRTLLGSGLVPLIALCRTCHETIEFGIGKEKRTLSQSQAALISLLTEAKSPKVAALRKGLR